MFKLIFPVDGFQRVERNFRYPFFPTISVIKWNCKQTVVSLIIKISFCFEFFFLFLSREKLRFFLTRIPRFNIYKYWIDLIPFQSFMDSWFPSVYPSEYNLQTWTKAIIRESDFLQIRRQWHHFLLLEPRGRSITRTIQQLNGDYVTVI